MRESPLDILNRLKTRDLLSQNSRSTFAGADTADNSTCTEAYENSRNSRNFRSPPPENTRPALAEFGLEDRKYFSNNNNNFQALSEVELASTEPDTGEAAGTLARAAKGARDQLSYCSESDKSVELLSQDSARVAKAADGWRQRFAELRQGVCPVPGLRDWSHVYRNIRRFLDGFADQADELGWSEVELFGVHRELGVRQVRYCGALILSIGQPVVEIDANMIRMANGLTFRRCPVDAGMISIFDFTKLHERFR